MAGAADTQPSVPGSNLFVQLVCLVHNNGHRHVAQKFKTLQKLLRFEMMLLAKPTQPNQKMTQAIKF